MNRLQLKRILINSSTDELINQILAINQNGVIQLPSAINKNGWIDEALESHEGIEYRADRKSRAGACLSIHLDWWAVQPTGIEPVRLCFAGIKNWECECNGN